MAGNLNSVPTVFSSVSLDASNGGQLSLNTASFSIVTAAAASAIPINSLGLLFRASGISLVYVTVGAGGSGITVYSFGSSGVGSSFASGTA
jgi:hypothetical protein